MLRLLLSLVLVGAAWCAPGIVPKAASNKLSTTTTQPPGCFYGGNYYQPGEVVVSETGCWGRTYTCETSGIHGHGIPGENCCTHEGQYYDDGDMFIDSAGRLCRCFGNSVESPVAAYCDLGNDVISG
ncbi:uncharacterized protein [Branchiostoma lanceolatum]|uniref:uncharacterized protein n=1 Tax=Branchiostoma lanceolatum TaxID=7740 RepID=UPI0034555EA9